MEISWKVVNLCLGLLFFELCNGLPIHLENTTADSHTQLLTGLVAVLLTVCSVVFLAGCLCCKRLDKFKEFRDSPVVASSASNLDHGHVNPVTNGEFTIFTPLTPPHHNNNVFIANQQTITRTQEDYIYGDVDVSSWFDGNEKEFPRIKLKYIRELGKGWFGRVVEGAAQNINDQPWTPVVVRILDSTASSRERVVFLHDAAIYRCGTHPNILQIFGRCLETVPLLLLQEYCPQGDFKNYLKENKETADKLLSTEYPLVWCCQLTSALKHLHQNKLIHPDLGTRNCQLTSNLTLKLGDYGLAVFKYPEDYYQGAPGVPVRWCSPESLTYTNTTIQPKKNTSEANIWSLGVTLWEICECGDLPYSNLSDDEVISQVLGSAKIRLPRPTYNILYTDYIYRLMQLCWTTSESRPAIAQIDLMLADLLQVHKNTTNAKLEPPISSEDFDRRWQSFKPNTIVKSDNHVVDINTTSKIADLKPLSPSLNNLHGSLDNLLAENAENQMESWLENIATKTGDMCFVKGLSDAMKDLDDTIASENIVSSDSSHQTSPSPGLSAVNSKSMLDFKLGPNNINSLTDSLICTQRASSGSETEDENWKKNVERGVYSEKVRLKSKSVQDLMVLTHIDCSESDPDTPLASLEYRINNYKNVRLAAPKENYENISFMYGSEGNLLNVKDTFKEELRKLQEERRDSLLFVPDKSSQTNNNNNSSELDNKLNILNIVDNDIVDNRNNNFLLEDSPSKRILQELNSTTDIKPANQIYNVFNITIDKFSPVHCNTNKLNEIINLKQEQIANNECDSINLHVPRLSDIIQNNTDFTAILSTNYESKKDNILDKDYDESGYQSNEKLDSVDRKNLPDILSDICEPCEKTEVPETLYEKFDNYDSIKNEIFNSLLLLESPVEDETINKKVDKENTKKLEMKEIIEKTSEILNIVEVDNTKIHSDMSETFQFSSPNKETLISDKCATNDNTIEDGRDKLDVNNEKTNEESLLINKDLITAFITNEKNGFTNSDELEKLYDRDTPNEELSYLNKEDTENETDQIPKSISEHIDILIKEHDVSEVHFSVEKVENKIFLVPTLVDIIQNDDHLIDFIIKHYDDDSTENEYLCLNNDKKVDCVNTKEHLSEKNCNSNDENTVIVNKEIKELSDDQKVPTKNAVTKQCNTDDKGLKVSFDLSDKQEDTKPNSLTHSNVFTSTPSARKSLQEISCNDSSEKYFSLNLFGFPSEGEDGITELTPNENEKICSNFNYSLETWDNFLGKALDNSQSESQNLDMFDSFSSEPQSLLFLESQDEAGKESKENESQNTSVVINTYTINEDNNISVVENNDASNHLEGEDDNEICNKTFTKEYANDKDDGWEEGGGEDNNETFNKTYTKNDANDNHGWEDGGGWFLHPQSSNEDISGEMVVSQKSSRDDSYVGFCNMDDEIMAAIRNELLIKLPHAQGSSSQIEREEEDEDFSKQNMIHMKYNIFKMPLSPIEEESEFESSAENTPRLQETYSGESEWSEEDEEEEVLDSIHRDTESQSAHTLESPARGRLHRHTPSQDSCCSNDTLFNLEELTCIGNEQEKNIIDSPTLIREVCAKDDSNNKNNVVTHTIVNNESSNNNILIKVEKVINDEINTKLSDSATVSETCDAMGQILNYVENNCVLPNSEIYLKNTEENITMNKTHVIQPNNLHYITDFLCGERKHSAPTPNNSESNTDSVSSNSCTDNLLPFPNKQMAPLPSPEDKPWKQLPACQLSYDKIFPQINKEDPHESQEELKYENIQPEIENINKEPNYENIHNDELKFDNVILEPTYENVEDIYNEADYINIVNLENSKYNADYCNVNNNKMLKELGDKKTEFDNELIIISNENDDDSENFSAVLTDIRFNGPGDSQLMSTSFSESNDLNDEQDWDSGSDTRSSSSGEFIWKEGEHEESLKALRAIPQDVVEHVEPMDEIEEEISSEESTCTDEDAETPEFVPSAWDKYAIPTKSALRSPEKSLENSDKKKSKGVWFKKQKYHCVYEYPREPESPILHTYDLYRTPAVDYSTFSEWEFDTDHTPIKIDDNELSQNYYQPNTNRKVNLYQLTSVPDFPTSGQGLDDEFYITSSSKPFHMLSGLSSQFFPGNSWFKTENMTPDSGIDDSIPADLLENNEFLNNVNGAGTKTIQSLKTLASAVVNREKQKSKKNNDVLGGLRHTRDKLKLDLPASPSAFTSNKIFSLDQSTLDPVVCREKPTFSTFGKSRFLVQHVDTPDSEESKSNVSFEALPYKPPTPVQVVINEEYEDDKNKSNVEIVRGEASLLDSADEDSGIESSTLERKLSCSKC